MASKSAATATNEPAHIGLARLARVGRGDGRVGRVVGAHWDAEMGAITQILTEKSGGTAPAILFDNVPGYPKGFRTLYGQLSSIRRIALTLGLPLELRAQGRHRQDLSRAHART